MKNRLATVKTGAVEINTGLVQSEQIGTPHIAKPKKDWEAERLHDRKPIRGRFLYHEIPGGELEFNFYKYKGDPVEKYKLRDGQEYTLPLGVAKHLNNIGTQVHEHAQDENGKPSVRIGSFERRCSFQVSLEHMGEADFSGPSTLYTVEKDHGLIR